jgi:hypothetical protein
MNANTVFAVMNAVEASLKTRGIVNAAGALVSQKPDVYASVAGDVLSALTAAGMTVNPDVQKAIEALPGILSLFGE